MTHCIAIDLLFEKTYKIWCGDFIVVTECVEEHSDWKLLVFRAEGTASPEFRCETVNRGHRFKSTVQRRFLEAA